jgi:hypothetical protein
MARFELCEVAPPHRRIGEVDSNTDPHDAEACVALLRLVARQHRRKPSEVLLRWSGGKRVLEYRD